MRTIAVVATLLAVGLAGCTDSNAGADSIEGALNDYTDHLIVVDLENMTQATVHVEGSVNLFSQGRGVAPGERDIQEFTLPEGAFAMVATLDWETTGPDAQRSDLDFTVRDEEGRAVGRGASLAKPEIAQAKRIQAGSWGQTWTTDVVNYANPPTSYTVDITFYLLEGYEAPAGASE